MGELENDKEKDRAKTRQVEVPNQGVLLSNLSRVHKAGDLSKSVIPEDTDSIEEAVPENNNETAASGNKPVPRRKKPVPPDESYYKGTFLKKNEADSRKNVYISGELHKTVSDIIGAVRIIDGKQVSVGSYIDNVLAEHFEAHREEINSLYRIGKNDLVK